MLNVLLQMTGSLCMKYAAVKAFAVMRREGVALDADGHPAGVANVHDEIQMEVPEDEVLCLDYELPFTLEGFENEKQAVKAVFDTEEKRIHIDSEGRMWSAANLVSVDTGAGVLRCRRRYHRAGHIIADAMTWAGQYLKMRCPMAGEYKIGKSWAETH